MSVLPKVFAVAVGPVVNETPTFEPDEESENVAEPFPNTLHCE